MKKAPHKVTTGLVLSGGGARAAYQAGVLHGISRILDNRFGVQPFPIITGVSAGAINASYLAAAKSAFGEQTASLAELWNTLEPESVIEAGALSLSRLGLSWMKDLASGGVFGNSVSTHLLDSAPLRELLRDKVSFSQIRKNVSEGRFRGVAVTTTSYATGTSITFFDAAEEIEGWSRSSRIGIKTPLSLEHVLASSSIPVFFRPVRIGNSFYGDGGDPLQHSLQPRHSSGS